MSPDALVAVLSLVFLVAALAIVFSTICLIRGGVLYLGSPGAVVRAMLALADIKPGERVFDLGCGDGRLLIPAVRRFKALATGIDISGLLLQLAWLRSRLWRAPVRLIRQNLLEADFSDADVIFVYLMPEILNRLQERLKSLKPGCRIICHEFGLDGWTADTEVPVNCWLERTRILRYRVGEALVLTAPAPMPAPMPTADRCRWPDTKMTCFY